MIVYVSSDHDTTMVNSETKDYSVVELVHDGGGMVKLSPAIAGRVWYDSYFNGSSVFHTSIKCEDVADLIMDLMNKGYYVK